MNHCVPDFDMDDDYAIPTSSASSSLNRSKKAAMGDEDIMELLWHDGQVVLQSQNQRSFRKSLVGSSGSAAEGEIPTQQLSAARETGSMENDAMLHNQQQPQLFMHEDEMASWLHYPIDYSSFDRDIYSDLLYPTLSAPISDTTTLPSTVPRETRTTTPEIRQLSLPPPSTPVPLAPRPPIPPPPKRTEVGTTPKLQNFMHFSRLPKTRIESGPSSASKATGRESTVVESNDTPALALESRVSKAVDSTAQVCGENVGCGTMSLTADAAGASTAGGDLTTTCELTVTSSPGGSGGSVSTSAEPPPMPKPTGSAAENRKRKGIEPDDAECHSEDIEFEATYGKRQARGSTSMKRSRAAEVHNLSERRRRDRINEKMRALQELIPRCNKSDKASMLDEAIEYLKSLQLQVQMMSMGCGMFPMMYPGLHQYMPAMGMGMGLGLGLGMDMGRNRPMMPYPPLMPGSGMPSSAAAGNMGPRFPVPAFHMQPIPVPDPSRIQAAAQPDPMLSSLVANNPSQPRVPNFSDPYQQFMGLQQANMSIPQNRVASQALSNKPSSSRDAGNPENQQTSRLHSFSLQDQLGSQAMSHKPSSSRDVGNPENQQTG